MRHPRTVLGIACLMTSMIAHAGDLGLNLVLGSRHFEDPPEGSSVESWEEFNPGIALTYRPDTDAPLRGRWLATGGVFRNSLGRTSWMLGVGPRATVGRRLELSLPIGVVSGYPGGYAFALPTASIALDRQNRRRLNFHFIPPTDKTVPAVGLSLQITEWR